MDSATSHTIAVQKAGAEGGTAPPTARAAPVKTSALVVQWTVIDTDGVTCVRERWSRKVAATSDSIPAKGMR
ncbi:hypothetical protein GCM10010377_42880 [Streptomyces viridiviolaceus]|nr:hypothetical protein GCM10010377_42880 [Streptomyces viridiviolaceus]